MFLPFYVCFDPLRVSIKMGHSTLYTSLFLKKYSELRLGDIRRNGSSSRGYTCAELNEFSGRTGSLKVFEFHLNRQIKSCQLAQSGRQCDQLPGPNM
jgi:hypothetical protein